MHLELISATGLLIMFVLGLRHGLDPDHIACIDGFTWHALNHQHKNARWVGTFFALGHGLIITAIAAGVSLISQKIAIPDAAAMAFGWVPTLLLVFVGTLNLRLLLRGGQQFRPAGWKFKLLPKRLRNNSSAWAIMLVGMLFATVFDTATQASAWGYVAANKGAGLIAAIAAGLVFTGGMMVTDTVDGLLICRINQGMDGQTKGLRFRKTVGWLIVAMSYGVAGYNIIKEFVPLIEVEDFTYSVAGLALMAIMLFIWLYAQGKKLRASTSVPQ